MRTAARLSRALALSRAVREGQDALDSAVDVATTVTFRFAPSYIVIDMCD